jgi:hypothetical protein
MVGQEGETIHFAVEGTPRHSWTLSARSSEMGQDGDRSAHPGMLFAETSRRREVEMPRPAPGFRKRGTS